MLEETRKGVQGKTTTERDYYSASQISTFLDCKRKWAFVYVEGMESPSSPSTELGTAVHKQLEEHYKFGADFDYSMGEVEVGEVAFCISTEIPIHVVPGVGAGTNVHTEQEFTIISPKHRYLGYIDLVDSSTMTIYDHKSTSNLRWAKTEEELMYDPQAVLYAVTKFIDWQVPEVNLQWTYGQTRGKHVAKPVRITMTAEHAGRAFAVIEQVADEMDEAKQHRALELAPSPETCEKYGGCPFRYLCNLSPAERVRSVFDFGNLKQGTGGVK